VQQQQGSRFDSKLTTADSEQREESLSPIEIYASERLDGALEGQAECDETKLHAIAAPPAEINSAQKSDFCGATRMGL
jgi:hypothetical protein